MPKTTAKKTTKKTKTLDFEKALNELENLVEVMEEGDMSLEDSLKQFERGVDLTQQCQSALKNAEQKVQILIEKSEQAELEDFSEE